MPFDIADSKIAKEETLEIRFSDASRLVSDKTSEYIQTLGGLPNFDETVCSLIVLHLLHGRRLR